MNKGKVSFYCRQVQFIVFFGGQINDDYFVDVCVFGIGYKFFWIIVIDWVVIVYKDDWCIWEIFVEFMYQIECVFGCLFVV